MGGDRGPETIVAGAAEAASAGIEPVLFGPPGLDTLGLPLVEATPVQRNILRSGDNHHPRKRNELGQAQRCVEIIGPITGRPLIIQGNRPAIGPKLSGPDDIHRKDIDGAPARPQHGGEDRQELASIRQQFYERYRQRRDRLSGLHEAVRRAARRVQERKREFDSQYE